MTNKLRYRIIYKLAQTSPQNNAPTDAVTNTKTVSGSPTQFIATDYYPSIIKSFNSKNAIFINKLTDIINQSLYYTSDGKVDLSWMRANNFNFGTSAVPSQILRNLMNFAKQIYFQIYTDNGTANEMALSAEEISQRILPLKNSQFLQNLSVTNPVGQLSNRIGGNVKTLINNLLLQIK